MSGDCGYICGVPTMKASEPSVRLVRSADDAVEQLFDPAQQRVIDHCEGVLRVLGGPGTGKTIVIAAAVAARLRSGIDPSSVIALTFGRSAAARLRDEIAVRSQVALQIPPVRTFESFAWSVLDRAQRQIPGWSRPRLITGAEQDLIIRELIAGAIDGEGSTSWPTQLRAALPTRGFARELRDTLMRCTERAISARALRTWAQRHNRPEWRAVAQFISEYSAVAGLRMADAYDPAELVRAVLDLFENYPEVLHREQDAVQYLYVDEAHDLDPAKERLIALLSRRARATVLAGDPDQSVFAFRGADPYLLTNFAADRSPGTTVLKVAYRAAPALLSVVRDWSQNLSGPAHQRRYIAPESNHVEETNVVEILLSPSDAAEASAIAGRLQRLHLKENIAWSQMAIVVRSVETSLPVFRRAFDSAGVPLHITGDEIPVAEHPAVAGLVNIARLADPDSEVDSELIERVLCSPYFGQDKLSVRRIRKSLRQAELASGGGRASAQILIDIVADPRDLLLQEANSIAPVSALGRLIVLLRSMVDRNATTEELLYAIWQDRGVEAVWRENAVAGGRRGREADSRLDAVIALFSIAADFSTRMPAASLAQFVAYLHNQDLPADRLTRTGNSGSAVRLVTANNAKGLQWDVVVVAAVEAERWPNLVPRGSLLGAEDLVDLAAGRAAQDIDRVAQMLGEERRLFYVAISRAKRRLIVSAYQGADATPSRFIDDFSRIAHIEPIRTDPVASNSLSPLGLVAQLRGALSDPDTPQPERLVAARSLAQLAAAGVEAANPDNWYGLAPLSDSRPLVDAGEPVTISPSKVGTFSNCQLRWFLERVASPPSGSSAEVGNLMHEAFAAVGAISGSTSTEISARMRAVIDDRFDDLQFESAWLRRAERTRLSEMTQKLAAWLVSDRDTTWVASESRFSQSTGSYRLRGAIDRVERDGDGYYRVIDLKTGKSAISKDDAMADPQLGIYQHAIQSGAIEGISAGSITAGAVLVYPALGVNVSLRDQDGLAQSQNPSWVAELLDATAHGMSGANFQATVDEHCRTCPVRSGCPASDIGLQVEP